MFHHVSSLVSVLKILTMWPIHGYPSLSLPSGLHSFYKLQEGSHCTCTSMSEEDTTEALHANNSDLAEVDGITDNHSNREDFVLDSD